MGVFTVKSLQQKLFLSKRFCLCSWSSDIFNPFFFCFVAFLDLHCYLTWKLPVLSAFLHLSWPWACHAWFGWKLGIWSLIQNLFIPFRIKLFFLSSWEARLVLTTLFWQDWGRKPSSTVDIPQTLLKTPRVQVNHTFKWKIQPKKMYNFLQSKRLNVCLAHSLTHWFLECWSRKAWLPLWLSFSTF